MKPNYPYSAEELAWIECNYTKFDWREMEAEFAKKFGYRRSGKAIQRKGYDIGLRKQCLGINPSWKFTPRRLFRMRVNRLGGVVNYLLNGYV